MAHIHTEIVRHGFGVRYASTATIFHSAAQYRDVPMPDPGHRREFILLAV